MLKLQYIYIYIFSKIVFFLLPDKKYFLRRHKKIFGYTPDFENPQTFNEKIVHRILYDRNPIYTLLADKLKVRIYIASKLLDSSNNVYQEFLKKIGGNEQALQDSMPIHQPINNIKELLYNTNLCNHLPKLYGIWDSVNQINFSLLPDSFVLKTNHDGGGIVIVKDKSSFLSDTKLFKASMAKLTKHLQTNWYSLYREYHYKNIEPKVFAEELLGNGELFDIRFHQFYGETRLIQVANFTHTHNNMYSKDWEKLDLAYVNTPSSHSINKPKNLEKMLGLANLLSKMFNYIRVDMFLIDEQIYIGELTFTPNGGIGTFDPPSYDEELGKFFTIK